MKSPLPLSLLTLVLAGMLWPAVSFAQHAGHSGSQPAARRPAPSLSVGAAFAPSGELWITGLDEKVRLFVQSSADLGRSWGDRRVLDTQGDRTAADGENRPKIAFGPKGWVVITYTKPLPKPYTGDIRMLRSEDGGKTFSPVFTVHDDRQPITHRFESTTFDSKGNLYVLWIDKRDAELARARSGGKRDAYDGAAVYGKISRDGAKTFEPDLKLADYSCECCRIALVETPQAGMVAMWRHVFPKSIRDHAFAPLSDLGKDRPPTRATEDQWELAACPHHGPGLANAAAGGFHSVWFGQRGGKAAVHYGLLDAAGKPVGPVRDLPDERAEHADIAASGNNVGLVWRSFDGERTRLRAWLSKDQGQRFELRELAASGEDNDHPRLVSRNGETWVVWRTERGIHVLKLFS